MKLHHPTKSTSSLEEIAKPDRFFNTGSSWGWCKFAEDATSFLHADGTLRVTAVLRIHSKASNLDVK